MDTSIHFSNFSRSISRHRIRKILLFLWSDHDRDSHWAAYGRGCLSPWLLATFHDVFLVLDFNLRASNRRRVDQFLKLLNGILLPFKWSCVYWYQPLFMLRLFMIHFLLINQVSYGQLYFFEFLSILLLTDSYVCSWGTITICLLGSLYLILSLSLL